VRRAHRACHHASLGVDGEAEEQWSYVFTDFTGASPARETISSFNELVTAYSLSYDGNGRLVDAASDDGDAITYNYDDAAGVITIDSNSGEAVGTLTYDDEGRPLTESWTGSHPQMIDSLDVYAWDGDALLSGTYSSGSEDAPHTLELVATETLRYSCESARRGSRSLRGPRLQLRR